MGVAKYVLSAYMVPLPILPPVMTIPPPRPPGSPHVCVGSLVHGPQGTTWRLTGYLRPKSYGLGAENTRSWPFVNTVLFLFSLSFDAVGVYCSCNDS